MDRHVLSALHFAANVHRENCCEDRTPYVNRLIETATLLADWERVDDSEILMTAVLQGVCTHQEVSYRSVQRLFGTRVSIMVAALDQTKALSQHDFSEALIHALEGAAKEIKLIILAAHCSIVTYPLLNAEDKEASVSFLRWSHEVANKCFEVSNSLSDVYNARHQNSLDQISRIQIKH